MKMRVVRQAHQPSPYHAAQPSNLIPLQFNQVLGGVDMFIALLSVSVQNEVVSKAAMVLDTVSAASISACVRIAQPDGIPINPEP